MVVPVVGFGFCKGPGCTNLVKHYKNTAPTKWCCKTCKARDYRLRRPDMYRRHKVMVSIKERLKRGTYKPGGYKPRGRANAQSTS